jgi:hypothetical protein
MKIIIEPSNDGMMEQSSQYVLSYYVNDYQILEPYFWVFASRVQGVQEIKGVQGSGDSRESRQSRGVQRVQEDRGNRKTTCSFCL